MCHSGAIASVWDAAFVPKRVTDVALLLDESKGIDEVVLHLQEARDVQYGGLVTHLATGLPHGEES